MTRIDAKFAELKAANKKAFVSYVMAGDPDFNTSLEIVTGLPTAGVDIIELGLPFTDPMADGPTIQLAGQRALEVGMTLTRTLELAAKFRETILNYFDFKCMLLAEAKEEGTEVIMSRRKQFERLLWRCA